MHAGTLSLPVRLLEGFPRRIFSAHEEFFFSHGRPRSLNHKGGMMTLLETGFQCRLRSKSLNETTRT